MELMLAGLVWGGVAVELGGEPVDPHEAQHFVAAGPCTLDRLS